VAVIDLGNDQPGIVGLLEYRPDTGAALSALADVLLRGPNSLSRGEREYVAAFVSQLNDCEFCANSHGAVARIEQPGLASARPADGAAAAISPKLEALLPVAAAVQRGEKIPAARIEIARGAGASDREIHDVALIAAAFCMYNRYVDGLDTRLPSSPDDYDMMARRIAEHGYLR
jgi:uncharacterized peroxidase-related enzyme